MPRGDLEQRTDLAPAEWQFRARLLLGLAAAVVLVMLLVKPIPQNPAYHAFCDVRPFFGVPNALNVGSNVLFLVIGAMGLRWLSLRPGNLDAALVAPYAVVFAGLCITAVGSAYYHWRPDNARLVWDRLPIAVSFMALYAAVIGERVAMRGAGLLLWPFAIFGVLSVLFWHWTDDLRLYALSQFFPVATIPLILWLFPPQYTRGRDFIAGIGFYAAAKLFEEHDLLVFTLFGGTLSGHTLKHLVAALGCYWIYRMLVLRQRS